MFLNIFRLSLGCFIVSSFDMQMFPFTVFANCPFGNLLPSVVWMLKSFLERVVLHGMLLLMGIFYGAIRYFAEASSKASTGIFKQMPQSGSSLTRMESHVACLFLRQSIARRRELLLDQPNSPQSS